MILGSIFSDHAVFQRGKRLPVWGTTAPETLVEVIFAGAAFYGKSSRAGNFMINLPSFEAGGPYIMKVSAPDVAGEEVVITDVLVGEVWFCGGQSNMNYHLGRESMTCPPPEGVEPLCRKQKNEFINTVCPAENIRFITVPIEFSGCKESDIDAQWQIMDKTNAPAASAIAAWFGSELQKQLQVPVGLICCSRGGTIVESWSSTAALRSNPTTRAMIEKWEALQLEKVTWTGNTPTLAEQFAEITSADRGISDFAANWANEDFDDSNWQDMTVPGSWIDQNIAANGAVWVRNKVMIPPEWAGKDLLLHTGGIDKQDISFFNGVEVGRTGKDFEDIYWNTPRTYTIPGSLVKAGANLIAIRGFSFAFDGVFMAPEDQYYLACGEEKIYINGTWKAHKEYDLGKIILHPRYGLDNHHTPGILFDSMVLPLLPFAVKGVIWYQGESNAENVQSASLYTDKLVNMIKDWRYRWEDLDMPFIQVQLADYRFEHDYEEYSAWARLRQCQNEVCRKLENVFAVTALSTGEAEDIHPQDKKEVGKRLAASAFYHVYGKSSQLPCGPEAVKAHACDGKLLIEFKYSENMQLRGKASQSFYLAGADKIFYPADMAEISGNTLVIASNQVYEPCMVRYAWANNPQNILWNREYPANAFELQAD